MKVLPPPCTKQKMPIFAKRTKMASFPSFNIEETVQRFLLIYNMNKTAGNTISSFHCGKTDNLERHKEATGIKTYLATTECDKNDIATALLEKLEEVGFTKDPDSSDISNALFVFLYKKA